MDDVATIGPKQASRRRRRRPGGVVALTGATGFIGHRLGRRLGEDDRYERLVLIDVQPPRQLWRDAVFYHVDLTEPLADARLAEIFRSEGVETVVHLAFTQSPTHRLRWTHELESVGTMHLLNALAASLGDGGSVRHLLVGSTTMVYGAWPDNPNFLEEVHPLRGAPGFRFVEDKVEVERQVESFRSRYGLPVTVLRSCWTLGARVGGIAARYLAYPVAYTVAGYEPLLQIIHEDDLVEAFKRAVDLPQGCALNVVGAGVLPLGTVLRLCGRPSVPLPARIAYPLIDALWLANAAAGPAPHLDYLRYLFVADGERARELLGFTPRYTIRETLASFVSSLRVRRLRPAA